MSKPNSQKKPADPRTRANLYALAALYLAYLFYKIAWPYLTHDPYGPSGTEFLIGTVVLGCGAVVLAYLSWRMFKVPRPETPEESPEESPEDGEALPEEAGENEED